MTPDYASGPRYQAIEHRLGFPLADWIHAGRKEGKSWRTLAVQVRRITGIRISHTALHNWFGQPEKVTTR